VLTGPAIVLEAECTTLVPPGWQLRVSAPGHLILTRTAA
jgi:5-oxoprolinase (ATP-hydrolysing)